VDRSGRGIFYSPIIGIDGLRKIVKILSKYIWLLGQEQKPRSPEYEADVLLIAEQQVMLHHMPSRLMS
jgi:hypothetical protein